MPIIDKNMSCPRLSERCRIEVIKNPKQTIPSAEQIIRIGLDTSKRVFQLHGVTATEEPVLRKKLRRQQMVAFFENPPPTVIAIGQAGAEGAGAHLKRVMAGVQAVKFGGRPLGHRASRLPD